MTNPSNFKIFLVWLSGTSINGGVILRKIYSSREKAEDYIEKNRHEIEMGFYFDIQERNVE